MQASADIELLRQYSEQNSEAAFAELVTRYVNLVYSAAARKTGNLHAAEEITQAVFIILAKKAGRLREGTILSGWLYQTARLTAANFLRHEMRRGQREQEAYMQSISTEPDTWPEIAPLLEDAMGRLNEKERNAIVLRFFEGKSFQEIGAAFGGTENAAKKRVIRGLEKLRKFFARQGLSSTTAIIAEKISVNSIQAAPMAPAKSIAAVAVTKGAAASLSTLTLVKGALKVMAWTKAKTAIIAGGVAIVLAAGTATLFVERHVNAEQFVRATSPWSDAGASTPKAALQSLAWALTQGKTDRAEQLMQWDETGEFNNSQAAMEHQLILASILAPAVSDMQSFRILSIKQTDNPHELVVNFEKTFRNNIRPFPVTAKLRRMDGKWRVVGHVEYFSNGGVSMLLPFTGSF